MKLHSFAAAIATLTMTLVLPACGIVIGTNHFDVVFEDASTQMPLRDFIVTDLQRCYDAWGTNVMFRPNLPVRHGSYIRVDVFAGPYWCDWRSIRVPDEIVTNANGQLSLMVPSVVTQKYVEAFDFKTNHLEKVLAADAFVDFLSSPEFANVTSNEVSNFFLVKDLPLQAYAEIGEGVLRDVSLQEFFNPSILGFTYRDKGPNQTNLWVLIPTAVKKKKFLRTYDVLPALWHDGKWKFSFWDEQE